jgi:outer membrane protein assembly factor BamE (lipoprotein component of BamABCDE complex)
VGLFKTSVIALYAAALLVGCSTEPDRTVDSVRVQAGMSRDDLKLYFGNPLRIEPAAAGGENWYYRFASRNIEYENSSGTSFDSGTMSNYASASATINLDKTMEECPVHISSSGFVIEPVPDGTVIRN